MLAYTLCLVFVSLLGLQYRKSLVLRAKLEHAEEVLERTLQARVDLRTAELLASLRKLEAGHREEKALVQELVLLWDDWWRKHESRWASRHARAKSTNDLESVKVSTIAQGDIVRTRQVLQDF